MGWLFYTIITMAAYAGLFFFMRAGALYIDSRLASLILNIAAVILIIGYLSRFYFARENLSFSVKGIMFVAIAGIFAAIGNLANFKAYELGGRGNIVIPIVSIGSFVIAAMLSYLFFKEQFSISKIIGIFFGIISMYLLVI